MINLTDYTTYDEVRLVLGLSEQELPDATLGLPMLTRSLHTRLYTTTGTFGGVTGTLITFFDSISADSSPTAAEENLLILIQQYATYTVAEACLTGLSMLALKTESDGEAMQARFASEATFRDVVAGVRQQLASLSAQLDQALGGEASYVLPILERVTPAVDVVTNESA